MADVAPPGELGADATAVNSQTIEGSLGPRGSRPAQGRTAPGRPVRSLGRDDRLARRAGVPKPHPKGSSARAVQPDQISGSSGVTGGAVSSRRITVDESRVRRSTSLTMHETSWRQRVRARESSLGHRVRARRSTAHSRGDAQPTWCGR